MKEFNTEAICIPKLHYMVDISDKIQQIYYERVTRFVIVHGFEQLPHLQKIKQKLLYMNMGYRIDETMH